MTSRRDLVKSIRNDELAALAGAGSSDRINAKKALDEMKEQIAINDNQNSQQYQLLPKTKKEALVQSPELATLGDIVEGIIRKLHFSCLYLVDKCLIKHIRPVLYKNCHEYSHFLDCNAMEIRKSMELSMAALVLVLHGIQHMQQKKNELTEHAESLAHTLQALNMSMSASLSNSSADIDGMEIIPEHIRKEMEEKLLDERTRMDNYNESMQLISMLKKKQILQVVVQPDEMDELEDKADTESIAAKDHLHSNRNHHHHHSPTKGKSNNNAGTGLSARSPRGLPGSNNVSPRTRKLDGKTVGQRATIIKPQDQGESANNNKDAYLNLPSNNNANNAMLKAQYELGKGYMSKHHIEALEQQIKKMQRDLEKAKLEAMTPQERMDASLAKKLTATAQVVKIWTLSKEDAAAIRLQKASKVFLKRLRNTKKLKNFCAAQIQAVVHNFLIYTRGRHALDRMYKERWSKLVIYWFLVKVRANWRARQKGIRLLQRLFRRKLFQWRIKAATRSIRSCVVQTTNDFVDEMLRRLEIRVDRIEKSLEIINPASAAISLREKIVSCTSDEATLIKSRLAKQKLKGNQIAAINAAISRLRRPSESFRNRLQIVENKATAIRVAVSSAIRMELLSGLTKKGKKKRSLPGTRFGFQRREHGHGQPELTPLDEGSNDRRLPMDDSIHENSLLVENEIGIRNSDSNNVSDSESDGEGEGDTVFEGGSLDTEENRANLLKRLLFQGSSIISEVSDIQLEDDKRKYESFVTKGMGVNALNLLEKVEKLQSKSSTWRVKAAAEFTATNTYAQRNVLGDINLAKLMPLLPEHPAAAMVSRSEETPNAIGNISIKSLQCTRPSLEHEFDTDRMDTNYQLGAFGLVLDEQLRRGLIIDCNPSSGASASLASSSSTSSQIQRSERSASVTDIANAWIGRLVHKAANYSTSEKSTNTTQLSTKDQATEPFETEEQLLEALQDIDKLRCIPLDTSVEFDFTDVDNDVLQKRALKHPSTEAKIKIPNGITAFSPLLHKLHMRTSEFRSLSLRTGDQLKPKSWLQSTCNMLLSHLVEAATINLNGLRIVFSLLNTSCGSGLSSVGSTLELGQLLSAGTYADCMSLLKGNIGTQTANASSFSSRLHTNKTKTIATAIEISPAVAAATMSCVPMKVNDRQSAFTSAYYPLFTSSSMIPQASSAYLLAGLGVADGVECVMQCIRVHCATSEEYASAAAAAVSGSDNNSCLHCVLDLISAANIVSSEKDPLSSVASGAVWLVQALLAGCLAGPSSAIASSASVFVAYCIRLCDCISTQWHSRCSRIVELQTLSLSQSQSAAIAERATSTITTTTTTATTTALIEAVEANSDCPTQLSDEYQQLLQQVHEWTVRNYINSELTCPTSADLLPEDLKSDDVSTRISLAIAISMFQYIVLNRPIQQWKRVSEVLADQLPIVDSSNNNTVPGSKQLALNASEGSILEQLLLLCGYERAVKVFNKKQYLSFCPVGDSGGKQKFSSKLLINKRVDDQNAQLTKEVEAILSFPKPTTLTEDITTILNYILVSSLQMQWKRIVSSDNQKADVGPASSTSALAGPLSTARAARAADDRGFQTVDGSPRSARTALRTSQSSEPADSSSRQHLTGSNQMKPADRPLRVLDRFDVNSLRELASHCADVEASEEEVETYTSQMSLFEYQQFLRLKQIALNNKLRAKGGALRTKQDHNSDAERGGNPVGEASSMIDSSLWMADNDLRKLDESQLCVLTLCPYSLFLILLRHNSEQSRALQFILAMNKLYRSVDSSCMDIITQQQFTQFVRCKAHRNVSDEDILETYNLFVQEVRSIALARPPQSWENLLFRILFPDYIDQRSDTNTSSMPDTSVMTFATFVFAVIHMVLVDWIDCHCLVP